MTTKIFGLSFRGMRSITTCANITRPLPSPVSNNQTKIATVGKQLLNKKSAHIIGQKKPVPLDQKKIIPFTEFVQKNVKPFEIYKENVSSLLDSKNEPSENDKLLKKYYEGFCRGRYKRYMMIMEDKGNPATAW